MKSARHYLEQASNMRDLAKTSRIESFQASCLRAAKLYERLARDVEQGQNAGPSEDEDPRAV